jgi:hypothetical protein
MHEGPHAAGSVVHTVAPPAPPDELVLEDAWDPPAPPEGPLLVTPPPPPAETVKSSPSNCAQPCTPIRLIAPQIHSRFPLPTRTSLTRASRLPQGKRIRLVTAALTSSAFESISTIAMTMSDDAAGNAPVFLRRGQDPALPWLASASDEAQCGHIKMTPPGIKSKCLEGRRPGNRWGKHGPRLWHGPCWMIHVGALEMHRRTSRPTNQGEPWQSELQSGQRKSFAGHPH